MATQENGTPREEQGTSEHSHPEPACLEAQKWIEAVTGKSFGDKDFRSALENGILLCELLSAIKPGLVKKINRLPTPIAGLDNLSVFLRGCEELGLKGAQLFDPGDLQDTSIRANLKDSDCNRKLKNVLNTVFWLGKAASGCASYSGPTLNLKDFEGLLAQMRVDSEESGESSQKRSVRDSGYDCWDSERSESLSPPRHTRDNSLDSLDSFGSRSQHSPSPDVVNRANSDGDSEADASGKRPDMRKDDMLARRTATSEARSSVPFNQFLPNRANASTYVLGPRRKHHSEEGEQRSQTNLDHGKKPGPHFRNPKCVTWAPDNSFNQKEKPILEVDEAETREAMEQKKIQKLEKAGIKVLPAAVRYNSPAVKEEPEVRSPSPNIILRRDNEFLRTQKAAWDSSSDGEEVETQKMPDVRKDDLASRRVARGPAPKVQQFVPPPLCSNKDLERWEGIRRASQQTLQERENSDNEVIPDIITRRENPFLNATPRTDQEEGEEDEEEEGVKNVPNKQKDDLALRRAQSRPLPHRDGPMSFASAPMSQADMQKWERLKMSDPSEESPVCQACLEKNYRSSFSGSSKAGRGHSKVVTFGAVTEIEQPVDTSEGEDTELLRRLMSKATVTMPTIGPSSRLSERERSLTDFTDLTQSTLQTFSEVTPTPAEVDARLALYMRRTEEEEEDDNEEEKIPDLEKDDMMARRTGVFHKQSSSTKVYHNRFLPMPGTKNNAQDATDHFPWSKKEADRSKNLRVEQTKATMETFQPIATETVKASTYHEQNAEDEDRESLPKPEKDDMMARRTGLSQKPIGSKANQFLPVPGSVKYNVASKQPQISEKTAIESSVAIVNTETQAPPLELQARKCALVRDNKLEAEEKDASKVTLDQAVRNTPTLSPLPTPATFQVSKEETGQGKIKAEERVQEVGSQAPKKPFWLEDDQLPPMMSRRVAFISEDTESASMGDLLNEDEVGHLPHISPSRYERMQEQYSNFKEDENQWQDDLARWKNRRRSASQDLIKKEEERKMIEKKMKEESDRRKSIKTYKEIIEEKERREAELCEAYRNAATPEEAAMVLQRYALRFTISDATLDSLKVPRPVVTATSPDYKQTDKELKPSSLVKEEDTEVSEQHKTVIKTDNKHDTEHADFTYKQEDIVCLSSIPTPPISPLKTPDRALPQLPEQHASKPSESPNTVQPQRAPVVQSQAKVPPAPSPLQRTPTLPATTLPSPPSRPVPLLAAKPWSSQSGNKSFKMDGLVRVNGETTETSSIHTPPLSPMRSPVGAKPATPASPTTPISPEKPDKDAPCERTVTIERTVQPSPPPSQTEKPPSATSSAISSLIGGRNCIITTTIVTELTHVEPVTLESHTNGQVNGTSTFTQETVEEQRSPVSLLPNSIQDISPTTTEAVGDANLTTETPMLNLAKRVNHWVWDPNVERKRLERWQQEQERLLQEQYEKEQEKLKKEWERAQLEVEEEERKHNEEERRILEETVVPLNPTGILSQPPTQTNITSPTEVTKAPSSNIPLQHNGHKVPLGNEGQHASKLHFFQDSTCEVEASRKQELLKTESLDHSPQPKQPQNVKRSGSHDTAVGRQQSHPSPHPPSPSRCVSGKRLCSGCSQPLGKGAAMIIDTLGLFFHMQCFKCGVCDGQLGDATAGTDVRIRNGQLSCHECYIASRGRGQPTTL
ncbi:LIM and calponin homology domains-containing protein 1-like isoform X2 [Periophthalmus magnuspinnatus]|uniref:LIM and calponin homology domains-containing protein 1-like isoform X2 n=1 Tax=Periophthalmus magnuspinnatus TaxID=409849 RepID=UPI00243716E1|nr:LIM and calponin homology domains-containing protein 1-like isoform X2 [Periophthalmus magnuspinnatus]